MHGLSMLPSTLLLTFLFEATFFFSLACRSQLVRHSCFLLLLWILYTTVLRKSSSPPANSDVGYAMLLLLQTWIASDVLVLTKDLHNTFRRLDKKGRIDTDISSAPFTERLVWGFSLVTNPRGIGWEHGSSPRLPYNQDRADNPRIQIDSRKHFLLHKNIALIISIGYFRLSSYITRSSVSSFLQIRIKDDFVWGFITSVVYVSRVVAYCNSLHLGLVIVMVGIGVWDYQQCPPLFGDWTEGYSLRNVWGRVWHQLLRRILKSHASFILSLFRISPNSTYRSSYYVIRSLTAILLSGLLHQTMASISPPRKAYNTVFSFLTGPDMQFFFSQALGVMLETVGMWMWRSLYSIAAKGRNEKEMGKDEVKCIRNRYWHYSRVIGYLWVVSWCSWTVQRHMNGVVGLGLMHDPDFDPRKFELNPPEMWKWLKN
ncbi:hypothetical protein E1B28_002114 [Marasmius oreades]|uniref:Wax synthase domain-containing protein n=1 Tax=Marasmius oreades TaxID=181124 RepID=A0A9P7RM89_9AGAR|nr:uncharacterized protein E1B28_002114 [Marasmius oreades]KAG7086154.1 hypothetical protein E1B28_002114 [Marasmius oreades]